MDSYERNIQIYFLIIRSVGAELLLADGQMDRDVTKLIVAIRNFANAHKNVF
jgi:hypothetical protein